MEMLESKWREQKFVCVGLDPDYQKLTREMRRAGLVEDVLAQFVCSIVDDTKGGVCAFKPNIAFYEAYGAIGLQALKKIVQYIRVRASGVPIILDIKRGDIGNTNRGYVQSVVEHFDVDGLTLHPYLGMEANKPFLELNKMLFWLCRTSNPGAGEFQDLPVVSGEGKPARPLYEHIADTIASKWNTNRNCGLVVGATDPKKLGIVRGIVGDMPILAPGIGAQGGDLKMALLKGLTDSKRGLIVSASSSVMYADSPRDEVHIMNERVQGVLHQHELVV